MMFELYLSNKMKTSYVHNSNTGKTSEQNIEQISFLFIIRTGILSINNDKIVIKKKNKTIQTMNSTNPTKKK